MKSKSTIRRASRDGENPYVQILKAPLRDKRLSWKARGLLAYILTNADTWKIYVTELEKHSDKDGRDSTAGGLKELVELGYVTKTLKQDDGGRFEGYDYEVHEIPVDPTVYGFSVNGLAVNGLAVNGKPVTNRDIKVKRKKSKLDSSAVAEAAAEPTSTKPVWREAIDRMPEPSGEAVEYFRQKKGLELGHAKDLATFAMEFKREISAVPGTVTASHWAIWEAVEFYNYWSEQNWGRGKTKASQLKNPIKDMAATIRKRVREQMARGKYIRPAPGSPEFGKKPWELNQDKPAERKAPAALIVKTEIEY